MSLEEIGEGNKALLCLTNSTSCCESTSQGGWFSPGPMATLITADMNDTTSFYTHRDTSVIQLNKVNEVTSSSGVFHCRIPAADGSEKIIYTGIYPNGDGRI